jgi:hypothetical protein
MEESLPSLLIELSTKEFDIAALFLGFLKSEFHFEAGVDEIIGAGEFKVMFE